MRKSDHRQRTHGPSEKSGALAAKPGTPAGAAVLVFRVAADLCEDRMHYDGLLAGATEAAST